MNEHLKQPPPCTTCGTPMAPILYGLLNADASAQAHRGQIIRGGCVLEDDSPRWGCIPCGPTTD